MDWILYFVFAAASLLAVRNTILMGLVGACCCSRICPPGSAPFPRAAEFAAAAALLVADRVRTCAAADAFQLHAAEWLLAHPGGRFSEDTQRRRPHVQHL